MPETLDNRSDKSAQHAPWRNTLHEVIFEADTPVGKAFDVALILCILGSVLAVVLESVNSIRVAYGELLTVVEWIFTLLFSAEYLLRLLSVGSPLRYARSFFGVVDLLAVVPTYISLVVPGAHYMLVIRVLRILRIFRILKLVQYLSEARMLIQALRASRRKIIVFLFAVFTMVIIFGSFMYVIEGEENGFTSIPRSIYWAIVTMTTVGYGDISPQTNFGQVVASLVMVLGYGIIAVPTGIVTVGMGQIFNKRNVSTKACPECGADGHDIDAVHCKFCGSKL
ncbi:MAG: ion transporter [Desulfuromonas sp.]|nr:ion transporter [Desulfuromonas sp.]